MDTGSRVGQKLVDVDPSVLPDRSFGGTAPVLAMLSPHPHRPQRRADAHGERMCVIALPCLALQCRSGSDFAGSRHQAETREQASRSSVSHHHGAPETATPVGAFPGRDGACSAGVQAVLAGAIPGAAGVKRNHRSRAPAFHPLRW
jgi:hypothetical protein